VPASQAAPPAVKPQSRNRHLQFARLHREVQAYLAFWDLAREPAYLGHVLPAKKKVKK
jgi:hypothetical protein